jgi:hypothetical protein
MTRIAEVSFYDPATGRLSGQTFSGPRESIGANTPAGLKAVEGFHDHLSRKVLPDGAVVDWQPERPSVNHEWHRERKRWQLTSEALSTEAMRQQSARSIELLEQEHQRVLGQALLSLLPENHPARARLSSIRAEIAKASGLAHPDSAAEPG